MQTILVGLSIPVICAIGVVAGMHTLVDVMCFFHQSVAVALALSFVFRACDAPLEEGVTCRGKGQEEMETSQRRIKGEEKT